MPARTEPRPPSAEEIAAAAERITPLVVRTPCLACPALSTPQRRVFLKLESLQVTGSFKARGAANLLSSLDGAERARGVVTCSSGNHGRAVAHMARELGVRAVVCVPEWVDPSKLAAIREAGAEAVLRGATYDEAEEESRRRQRDGGHVYAHPFDDPRVIAGQGTVGLEILEQVADLDAVVVPLSGGGLISGIATALGGRRPAARVVAASAARAAAMLASLEAGEPVDYEERETLATALAGALGDNRYTLALVRDLVDEHVVVEEEQIAAAMAWAYREQRIVVEGGGAVGIAALRSGSLDQVEGTVVVVVSGGNVDPRTLLEVLEGDDSLQGTTGS